MLKPNSLRQALTAAVPELKTAPDKLTLYVRDGKLVSTGAGGLSFEYRYTLNVMVQDYGGHADAIMVPLLAWLRVFQPEIAENPEQREQAVRFEVEQLNAKTVDLLVEVDLTERVIVKAREGQQPPGKAYDVKHVPELGHVGAMPSGERWEFYLRDQLLAAWEYDPRT